jgi:hypothetical protein
MEPVGGPIIGEDPSKRWLARMLLGLLVVGVVVTAVVLATRGGGEDVAADRVGEAIAEETDPTATTLATGDTGTTPATEVPPSTAPAGEPDLLRGDATQAFGAFADIYEGAPVKVLEILVYPDWAYVDVQVPDEPTHVDEYTWRGGDGVSGPEPQQMLDMEIEELPDKLFDLSEIDPSKFPAMTEQALAQFPEEGMEVTHVIIDRFLPFDTRVLARVYVSHPDRGGGGYVEFTPDGGFVETV